MQFDSLCRYFSLLLSPVPTQPIYECLPGGEATSGQVFETDFSDANIDSVTFRSASIEWSAGATGHPDGEPVGGATLLIWRDGAWFPVKSNAAHADNPSPIVWTTEDEDEVRRMVRDESMTFAAAVRGTANAGSQNGRIASDYVALKLSYRHDAQTPNWDFNIPSSLRVGQSRGWQMLLVPMSGFGRSRCRMRMNCQRIRFRGWFPPMWSCQPRSLTF